MHNAGDFAIKPLCQAFIAELSPAQAPAFSPLAAFRLVALCWLLMPGSMQRLVDLYMKLPAVFFARWRNGRGLALHAAAFFDAFPSPSSFW